MGAAACGGNAVKETARVSRERAIGAAGRVALQPSVMPNPLQGGQDARRDDKGGGEGSRGTSGRIRVDRRQLAQPRASVITQAERLPCVGRDA